MVFNVMCMCNAKMYDPGPSGVSRLIVSLFLSVFFFYSSRSKYIYYDALFEKFLVLVSKRVKKQIKSHSFIYHISRNVSRLLVLKMNVLTILLTMRIRLQILICQKYLMSHTCVIFIAI